MKATEIVWKHPDHFSDIVLRMGVFHTVCTLLSIVGKRFQDAGFRDIGIESGAIAEGSVTGVLQGHDHNRAVRFHKLMYEALQRLIWKLISDVGSRNISCEETVYPRCFFWIETIV